VSGGGRPPGFGGDTGQVVAAGSAGGSIYDLGYRHYTGPRLGRRHAVASLIRHSFRMAYGLGRPGRAKIIPMGLFVLATLPAIVALGVTALAGQLGAEGEIDRANPVRYDSYYSIIAQMVALFAAAQAPELLGRDLRSRVLALYFTRALRRDDYAAAKVAAMVLAMLLLIAVPQLLIFVGRILVAPDIPAAIGRDVPELPPVIAMALLTAFLLGGIGLAIASFSPRRSFATAGIIAAFVVPPIVTAVAVRIAGEDLVGPLTWLSPPDILIGSNAYFFDLPVIGQAALTMPLWTYPVAGVVLSTVAIGVLVWRYRRIEP
jgi:ABC-2 type transport system permease protein